MMARTWLGTWVVSAGSPSPSVSRWTVRERQRLWTEWERGEVLEPRGGGEKPRFPVEVGGEKSGELKERSEHVGTVTSPDAP